MTPNQKKEEISKAYLHAVAAACGYNIGSWEQDEGCIDATIGAATLFPSSIVSKPKIDVQLKCSSDLVEHLRDNKVVWRLTQKHYSRLRARASIPHFVVILLIPELEQNWISFSTEALSIKKCAYWKLMTGLPEEDTETIQIEIPLCNVFSPEKLREIMSKVSNEETI